MIRGGVMMATKTSKQMLYGGKNWPLVQEGGRSIRKLSPVLDWAVLRFLHGIILF